MRVISDYRERGNPRKIGPRKGRSYLFLTAFILAVLEIVKVHGHLP